MKVLCKWYLLKIFTLTLFLVFDLVINGTSEFKDFSKTQKTWNRVKRAHLLLAGFQIIGQISTFLCIFLLFCDTFPFQVGLLGVLTKRYSTLLRLYLIYFGMTCLVNGLRVVSNFLHSYTHFSSIIVFNIQTCLVKALY